MSARVQTTIRKEIVCGNFVCTHDSGFIPFVFVFNLFFSVLIGRQTEMPDGESCVQLQHTLSAGATRVTARPCDNDN